MPGFSEMTTINTMEDLIRLLDENPEWLEALRSRLLTRELLEMPQTLARFIETTNRRFEELEENTNRRFNELEENTNRRFNELEENTNRRFNELEENTNRRFDALERRSDRMERDIQTIRNDMGILRASHARNAAVREAFLIAQDMGLRHVETLSLEQVGRMVEENDTSDLASGDRRSFILADLIIRAVDGEGRPCYIAVEISYTANGRDTSRAVRNAGYLTRFTGQPAYPAIAGIRLDDRVKPEIDGGEVFFYELEDDVLEVE